MLISTVRELGRKKHHIVTEKQIIFLSPLINSYPESPQQRSISSGNLYKFHYLMIMKYHGLSIAFGLSVGYLGELAIVIYLV